LAAVAALLLAGPAAAQQPSALQPPQLPPAPRLPERPVDLSVREVGFHRDDQAPDRGLAPGNPEAQEGQYRIQLEPPGSERVFRTESERALYERIRQEFRQRNEIAYFPKDPVLGDNQLYGGRAWPVQTVAYVPLAMGYEPLYFEDINAERYAWDAGIFQPFLSLGKFYVDFLTLPYNMGVIHPWAFETDAGFIRPGDPAPYLCYVPPFSWTGLTLEAAAVFGYFAVFG
jgi:hypothetical protein